MSLPIESLGEDASNEGDLAQMQFAWVSVGAACWDRGRGASFESLGLSAGTSGEDSTSLRAAELRWRDWGSGPPSAQPVCSIAETGTLELQSPGVCLIYIFIGMLANGNFVSAHFIPLFLSLSGALGPVKSIFSPTVGTKLPSNRDVKQTKCSVCGPPGSIDAKSRCSVGCLSPAGGLVPIHVRGDGRVDANARWHQAPETQRRGRPERAQRCDRTEGLHKLHFRLFRVLPPKS